MEEPIMFIPIIIIVFFIFFIGMWTFVLFILSQMGWGNLAKAYFYDDNSHNYNWENIGLVSARINWVNYNNSLTMKVNEEGIYLKPLFLFKFFHEPILIRWEEIIRVKDTQLLFFTMKKMEIGDPHVANISIYKKTYQRLERDYGHRMTLA